MQVGNFRNRLRAHMVCEWAWVSIPGERDLPKSLNWCSRLELRSHVQVPAPIAQLVESPLRGTGGHGFDPGPRHTKVVKNGTSCSSLDTQTYGVELGLVDPVSG